MFSEADRKIFSYTVGGETRWADPLQKRRELLRESAGNFWTWWSDSVEPEEFPVQPPPPKSPTDPPPPEAFEYANKVAAWMKALDANETLLACMRKVFDLPPFDVATKTGVPESEVWDVLAALTECLEGNAASRSRGQTTSPADSQPQTDTTSTTQPSSDCN